MYLNLKHLKISSILFYIVLFYSCNNSKNNLNCVSFVINKKVLINKNINTASTKYRFENNYYSIEKDIYFDANGIITKVGVSKGEGLLFYYRDPSQKELSLNEDQKKIKVQINGIDNTIIDNNDTIRLFEVNCDRKTIYYKNQKLKRLIIYKFE